MHITKKEAPIGTRCKYPFGDLTPGDCLTLEASEYTTSEALRSTAHSFARRQGWRFSVRIDRQTGTAEVYRLADKTASQVRQATPPAPRPAPAPTPEPSPEPSPFEDFPEGDAIF